MMTCPRCQMNASHGFQIYMVDGELGKYIFDVARARRITADGRPAYPVDPKLVEMMLEVNEEHTPQHIDHVDPTRPGIIAQRFGGYALIDGNHRARRCLRDHLPFSVYALTLQESMECLIHQDQKDFTPELVAREIRGMLKNNQECEMMTIALTSDEGAQSSEAAIRACLSEEENARVSLTVEQGPPAFSCPDCRMVSYNPNDIANRYCGNCHAFKPLGIEGPDNATT